MPSLLSKTRFLQFSNIISLYMTLGWALQCWFLLDEAHDHNLNGHQVLSHCKYHGSDKGTSSWTRRGTGWHMIGCAGGLSAPLFGLGAHISMLTSYLFAGFWSLMYESVWERYYIEITPPIYLCIPLKGTSHYLLPIFLDSHWYNRMTANGVTENPIAWSLQHGLLTGHLTKPTKRFF